jgi:hypothetical protein
MERRNRNYNRDDVEDKAEHWVHVIFPETDKHYAFQQSFNSKDLIIV